MEKLVRGRDEEFWALKNINLTIRKGERVGIIGPNRSDKTTLLKIIAGITTPTTGTVETHGKIVSLIDLEAGFHPRPHR
ncbi:ABC transporter ATP-binding protein [Candidatus Gottesmanbacteria bacterium]|nr:ABC transporter ATP-binding protein [Candidatus Gottesmanbacteria bacterium]